MIQRKTQCMTNTVDREGDRLIFKILLKNPPFILREPQDERRSF
jgi:hypothetical protein